MSKFSRIAQILREDGVVGPEGFHPAAPALESWLERAHDPGYVPVSYTHLTLPTILLV